MAFSQKLRFDFYQTDTAVNISVFVKGAKPEDVDVAITTDSLKVVVKSPDQGSESALTINPLFSEVIPQTSSFRILPTKIDVRLDKQVAGIRWSKLEGDEFALKHGSTPSYEDAVADSHRSDSGSPTFGSKLPPLPQVAPPTSNKPTGTSGSTSTTSGRLKSKWESFKLDDEEEGGEAEADKEAADINKFFQQLYKDADDDTRKAMIKSYQESGGTTLSTDWSKVGSAKVVTQPPEGMVAKKWEQ
ncbi:CS-domain-containing protein [Violaceomyces palustris]|uniref:CS-domain-containing protein n=1 Tax=Violaceomyces palustris TaxID=1673888 RepID=A0ACD0NTB0_9BASI|nr:CS-domain-containing protein [Violaceomyces palustris]